MRKVFLLLFCALILFSCETNLSHKLNPFNSLNESRSISNLTNSFPMDMNHDVYKYINFYVNNGRRHLNIVFNKSRRHIQLIKNIIREERLPEELAYLPVIESGFNEFAYSPKKAGGLWQFIPSTGRIYGLQANWWIDERRDIEKSTRAAAKHLSELYNHYKNWYLTLAAYNAGGGKISKAMKKYKTKNFWEISNKKKTILKKETRNYVPKMVAISVILNNPDKFGFELLQPKPITEYEYVNIPDATDLNVIAECCGSTFNDIKSLNPELRQWATPPFYENYQLKIPKYKKNIFLSNFTNIPPEERITYRRHKIKPGETIYSIVRKYRTDKESLCKLNNLKNPSMIVADKYIIIPIRGEKKKESEKKTSTTKNKVDSENLSNVKTVSYD